MLQGEPQRRDEHTGRGAAMEVARRRESTATKSFIAIINIIDKA
jgi:hypothetical protein